jgi:hypothetical protein
MACERRELFAEALTCQSGGNWPFGGARHERPVAAKPTARAICSLTAREPQLRECTQPARATRPAETRRLHPRGLERCAGRRRPEPCSSDRRSASTAAHEPRVVAIAAAGDVVTQIRQKCDLRIGRRPQRLERRFERLFRAAAGCAELSQALEVPGERVGVVRAHSSVQPGIVDACKSRQSSPDVGAPIVPRLVETRPRSMRGNSAASASCSSFIELESSTTNSRSTRPLSMLRTRPQPAKPQPASVSPPLAFAPPLALSRSPASAAAALPPDPAACPPRAIAVTSTSFVAAAGDHTEQEPDAAEQAGGHSSPAPINAAPYYVFSKPRCRRMGPRLWPKRCAANLEASCLNRGKAPRVLARTSARSKGSGAKNDCRIGTSIWLTTCLRHPGH